MHHGPKNTVDVAKWRPRKVDSHPPAFTKMSPSYGSRIFANEIADLKASESPLSVGRRALTSFPPAARKEDRRCSRWRGTLMQIVVKPTADWMPSGS